VSAFSHVSALDFQRIWDGIYARSVHGERMTLGVVELDPGAVAPEHAHPHEQFGLILSGSAVFHIGGETKDLGPGDLYVIPGNVPHSAEAGRDGTVLIDVFSPVREEWRAAGIANEREPLWPN
jgi:quercetin dioxygenase-like cupin family protein